VKRTVPLLITAILGLLLIVSNFVPVADSLGSIASIHFDILASLAAVLGGGNLLRSHGEKVLRRQAGWGYSAIAVIAFVATLGVGLFKVGVTVKPGYWCLLTAGGQELGIAQLDAADGARGLTVTVYGQPAGTTPDVVIAGQKVGTCQIGERGKGDFSLEYKPSSAAEAASATSAAVQRSATSPYEADPALLLTLVKPGDAVQVGNAVRGTLVAYGAHTGEFNEDGSALGFAYEYGMRPLQSTMFALLAFYVASAAFRAFRARNVESVLLLGTAFLILLGRTVLGTWLTAGLPQQGFWSFFTISNLTTWVMQVFTTAGTRAIMIGVALGIASTSLKVLLGIDRSYLGQKGD
jgi:hypothetical protein